MSGGGVHLLVNRDENEGRGGMERAGGVES